jgi:hypothetical protein
VHCISEGFLSLSHRRNGSHGCILSARMRFDIEHAELGNNATFLLFSGPDQIVSLLLAVGTILSAWHLPHNQPILPGSCGVVGITSYGKQGEIRLGFKFILVDGRCLLNKRRNSVAAFAISTRHRAISQPTRIKWHNFPYDDSFARSQAIIS